jgi:predicted RNase H-like nuclease (RuvC/YqgF family)
MSANKELLAQALREYPTWGDAYITERKKREVLERELANMQEERDRWREAASSIDLVQYERLREELAARVSLAVIADTEKRWSETLAKVERLREALHELRQALARERGGGTPLSRAEYLHLYDWTGKLVKPE